MESVDKLIRENTEKLSKSQRKIAFYILENIKSCGYLKAAQIAEEIGVSEATVVRFASALGFSGYPELQKALRKESLSRLTSFQRMELVSRKIGDDNMLVSVLREDIQRIEDTIKTVSEDMFIGAVSALSDAENVYVAGVRSSSALASFAAYYFNVLFKNVRRISSGTADYLTEQLIHGGKNDVILGISFPRYSSAIVRGLEFAKKRGMKVIALTDSENSPIVKYADYVLTAKSDMDSFADSLVAPMSIINALIFAAAKLRKNEIKETFSELENIWDEYNVYDGQ